ncbi:MAG: hypothetical protein ACJA1A_002141 [Saprospiraceae bacterium]
MECADTPSLYIDVQNSMSGESLLFGTNASLNISEVNVFGVEGNDMVSFTKLGFRNPSISPDSFLLVRLEPFTSNMIFFSTDSIVIDTIELFTHSFPESSCCDATQEIDSLAINGTVSLPLDWPLVFFREF